MFIWNQVYGLTENGNNVDIITTSKGDPQVRDNITNQYNLHSVNQISIKTYSDGFRSLAVNAPKSLYSNNISNYEFLSLFKHGKKVTKILELFNTLDSKRFDVFHAHFGPRGNIAHPATNILDLPLIVSFYGYDVAKLPKQNPNRYDDLFETSAYVTALTVDMKEKLTELGCPESKIRIVPLAIDTNQYTFSERSLGTNETIQLLTVARFVEKKGLKYALKAVSNLNANRPIEYNIIGDGPLRDEIEFLIQSENLTNKVNLLGYKKHNEVIDYLENSHIFILPSVTAQDGDEEGTPTILLEAQASGLPIISTKHAGIPEIVDDGETGVLVPERNVDELTKQLDRLVSSPSIWKSMGTKGRINIENNHSISFIRKKLENMYLDAYKGN